MEQALALIGDPHLLLPTIHIAGTKGKGSVAAMLDSCLRAAGYRCGLYTKPHLIHLTERTRVDGAEIRRGLMLEYIERLRTIYDRADMALTFFEFTVALMFLYFAEAGLDIAVIETGLGGRLDSTNVVRPLLSVITPIGFDHVEYLGYSIASIAAEKGGIIKPATPVVVGARQPEARTDAQLDRRPTREPGNDDRSRILVYVARSAASARLPRAGTRSRKCRAGARRGRFSTKTPPSRSRRWKAMRAQGWRLEEPIIRHGLKHVTWPGRFDVVSRRPAGDSRLRPQRTQRRGIA